MKTAPDEKGKSSKLRKLLLLWLIPSATLIATLVAAKESLETDNNAKVQAAEIGRQSNELISVKGDLELQRNPPFVLRLKTVLEAVDPKIMPALTNGATNFHGMIDLELKNNLQRLASDPNNTGLLRIKEDAHTMQSSPDRNLVSVNFDVSRDFLKQLSRLRPQLPKQSVSTNN